MIPEQIDPSLLQFIRIAYELLGADSRLQMDFILSQDTDIPSITEMVCTLTLVSQGQEVTSEMLDRVHRGIPLAHAYACNALAFHLGRRIGLNGAATPDAWEA